MLQHLDQLAVDGFADRALRPRILNATNGSPASLRATAAAAVIANERDAELIVMHVRPSEAMRVGRPPSTIVHNVRLGDPHGSEVLSGARRVAWANGTSARVVLMSGDPVSAIVSLADELAVGLIVIGARRSRVPAVFGARTRCRIPRAALCPVRIVALPVSASARGCCGCCGRCLRREDAGRGQLGRMLTVFGVCVVTFMMVMYALEGVIAGSFSRSRSGVRCRVRMASWRAPGRSGWWRRSGRWSR